MNEQDEAIRKILRSYADAGSYVEDKNVEAIKSLFQTHTAKAVLDAKIAENETIKYLLENKVSNTEALMGAMGGVDIQKCVKVEIDNAPCYFPVDGKDMRPLPYLIDRLADLQNQRNALDKEQT